MTPATLSLVTYHCVEDGITGACDDLSAATRVDIANGVPTEEDATNVILATWVDGSADCGATWSAPQAVEQPGDRSYYSAVGISPHGTDAYLVYNAFTT